MWNLFKRRKRDRQLEVLMSAILEAVTRVEAAVTSLKAAKTQAEAERDAAIAERDAAKAEAADNAEAVARLNAAIA